MARRRAPLEGSWGRTTASARAGVTHAPLPAAANLPRTDAELVRDVAEGRREALGELYDRFAPRLLGVAQRLLRSRGEAEDLVHDVFIEAWRRAGSYEPARASVASWLLLLVRSRALDRLRSARRWQSIERVVALSSDAQHALPSPAEFGDAAALRAFVTGLPVDQRAVLELGFFAGCSYPEIARRLLIPVGTVKSRMARALQNMRAQLGVYGAES